MDDNKESRGIRAKKEFSNFIEEVDIKDLIPTKVKGKFLLIKYMHDKSREEEFYKFIFNNLTTYALSCDERSSLSPQDADKLFQLWKIAVERFIQNSKTGEFGEIILFHLLEVLEGAVQIVNKMTLKTSGNMPIHGADAIHFGFDGESKILYLGESKTGIQFSDVLRKALSDTDAYYKNGKREFDINLISGNISEDIPENMRKLIKDYLNPCKADLSDYKEAHAIFLGFQMDCLQELEKTYEGKDLINKAIESYKADVEKYVKDIESKFTDFPDLADKRFLFFVIPFKDMAGLRDRFAKAIQNGKNINI